MTAEPLSIILSKKEQWKHVGNLHGTKTIVPIQIEEIEVKSLWFVDMQKMVWDESESVWITKENTRVSPYRLTQQEADDDFHNLGCIDLSKSKVVSAQSIIVPNRLWLRFIVQCKSFNHLGD